MMAFLLISATSLPAETTAGLLLLYESLLDVPGTGEAL
jgi:hypothetical protein